MFDRLKGYLDSVKARDPSPRSRWEILFYPGVWALGLHRVAHWLYEAKLYFLARFVNHFSRFLTLLPPPLAFSPFRPSFPSFPSKLCWNLVL